MNLRNNHKIQSLLLALFGLLTLTQCYAPRDEFEEGLPVTVKFAISVPESPVQEMRSTASADDENMLYNVALFVFDGADLSRKPQGFFFDNIHEVQQKDVEISTTTGKKKIVAITNLATDTHKTITGLKKSDFFNTDGSSKVNSIDDLNNKMAVYNTGEETAFADGDAVSFLMSSDPNVEYTVRNDDQIIDIHVARLAAKIEFKLDVEGSPKFTPEGWRVVNLPKKAYIVKQAMDATKENTADDYFNSFQGDAWHEWEGSGYGDEFSFYSFENRKKPQKNIEAATTPNEVDRYRLRAKRKKQATGQTGDGKIEQNNLGFEYAPEYCTYVQIRGRYEGASQVSLDGSTPATDVTADVVYTIPLGYYNKDANDYKVERNVYYQYKVKVVGVKDVIVEAKREAPGYTDAERHPGTEGIATSGKPKWDWVIDSHYEQRLWDFTNGQEYINLDLNALYFVLSTPFGNMSFTGDELRNNAEIQKRAIKLTDWIKIRRNNMTGYQNWLYYYGGTQDQLCRYPSQDGDGTPMYSNYPSGVTEDDLLKNIYEWFRVITHDKYKIEANGNAVPYTDAYYSRNNYTGDDYTIFAYKAWGTAQKDHCYATVYFDEYYYEKHPLTGEPVKWDSFVGKGPRSLAVYKKRNVSRDGHSIYLSDPLIRVVQHPIYTFYDRNSVDVPLAEHNWCPSSWSETNKTTLQGFGVESFTEPKFIEYPRLQNNTDYRRYKTCKTVESPNYNGWANWTHLAMLRDLQKHAEGWYNYEWKKYYTGNGKDLLAGLHPDYSSARYACLEKNRDLDRDGVIDPNELRWYLPSINQLMELGLADDAFPEHVRLYNSTVKGGTRQNFSYVSSTIREVASVMNTSYLWSSQIFATNSDPRNLANGSGDEAYKGYSHRCVRRLGASGEYFNDKGIVGYDLSARPYFEGQGDEYLIMELSGMNPHLIRLPKYFVSSGEQPEHTLQSEVDKPYKYYYVSRALVPWNGDNTCANYKEGKFSKPGDWRLPNMREMGYIITAFDLGEKEEIFKHLWGDGTSVKLQNDMVFVTRTTVNGDSNRMHMRYRTGYQWHVQSGTDGLNGNLKYVRCVKDKR